MSLESSSDLAPDPGNMPKSELIAFIPKPGRPPPRATSGVLGWLRENLFYSWLSTLLTFGGLYLIIAGCLSLYDWGIASAVWEASSRRECLDISPDGACWAGVRSFSDIFIYGRYPDAEQWRINLGFAVFLLWVAPLWMPGIKDKATIGVTAAVIYPFLAGYLFAGGERGWFLQLMVSLAVAVFAVNWLHVVLCLTTRRSLKEWLVYTTGLHRKHESVHKYAVFAVVAATFVIASTWLWDWSVVAVRTNLWGGLFLTFVMTGVGVTLSLPCGVVLALGRRSKLPVIRAVVIAYIELLRSLPLITVLFMAVTMLPLFLPYPFELNKLAVVLVAIVMFSSAYMAEVVRGGIQAVPLGQIEAARSVGLRYWQVMRLVVLPQALRFMIPNIASSFIGLLKDTTVVSIIGLYDFLLALRVPGSGSTWIGLHIETFFVGGFVYFVLCFSVSKYSGHLERKLGQNPRQ